MFYAFASVIPPPNKQIDLINVSSMMLSFIVRINIGITSIFLTAVIGLTDSQAITFSNLDRAQALSQHARQFYDNAQYDRALGMAEEALTIREKIFGPTHLLIAEILDLIGLIHYQNSRLDIAKDQFDQSFEIRQALLPKNHLDRSDSFINLGKVWIAKGDLDKASRLIRRALKILGEHQDTSVKMGICFNYLGQIGLRNGHLEDAQEQFKAALAIFKEEFEPSAKDYGMALNGLGSIKRRKGNFVEARKLIESGLQIREEAFGPNHPLVAVSLSNLVEIQYQLKNYEEALKIAERVVRIHENVFASDHPAIGTGLTALAKVNRELGNLRKSKQLLERALIIQKLTLGPTHSAIAGILDMLAMLERDMGDVAQAEHQFLESLKIRELALGPKHPLVANTLSELGWLLAQKYKYEKAESLLVKALKIREQAFGTKHVDVASSLMNLARVKHAKQEFTKAWPLYERARQIYLSFSRQNFELGGEDSASILNRNLDGLHDYAILLAHMAEDPTFRDVGASVISDGFVVAEQSRSWLVQTAVAQAMVRRKANDQKISHIMEEVERLQRRRRSLWSYLHGIYGQLPEYRNEVELDKIRQEMDNLESELEKYVIKLETRFPRYAEIVLPEPIDIETTKRLLRPSEALISFFTLRDRVQVWLVRSNSEPFYFEVPINKTEVVDLIDRLRISLEPISELPPYDVEIAFRLYRLLLEPIKSYLKGITNLILVPDTTLLALPFAALITEWPQMDNRHIPQMPNENFESGLRKMTDYAEFPWLIKSYPLTVLPSVSVLKLLQGSEQGSENNIEPFIGFGDPVLKGTGRERGVSIIAAPGGNVTRDSIIALNRLPGTKDELLSVASALEVPSADHVYIGSAATETQVKRLNASGRLGRARVLAFATHGLLSRELKGLMQPALVLTPPKKLTLADNGLLSMDEILQLQLPYSDWVLLSACNTAGDDGSGVGLSGLARAFFYAGAKTLLVSQWSVDDEATKVLMEEIFRRYAQGHLSSAEAVRQGILAVMDRAKEPGNSYFAHPFAWAPFFLVGDGRSHAIH